MGAISASDGFQPDYGPQKVDPAAGVACIGATPWVTNLNVPLETSDVGVSRRIALRLSARGGGLAHVEAMALPHTSGWGLLALSFTHLSSHAWHARSSHPCIRSLPVWHACFEPQH